MRSRHSLVTPVALLVVFSISAGLAEADPKADAQKHIDRAGELFAADKPAEALDALKTAYALDPQPQLLYGIGQVHASLGQCAEAKTFYERFLATKPRADVASVAREAITACKDKPQETKVETKVETKPVVAPPPPADPLPWYTDYVGDALVGAGVICGVIAFVEYRAAKSDRDEAEVTTNFQTFSELIDSSNTKRTISIVLGVAGVGLIGGGVARFLLHDRGSSPRIEVAPTQGGATITWGGRF